MKLAWVAGLAGGLMMAAAASPAGAQANVVKDCAAKYQAAKAGGTLPAGQTWLQYLAQCRGGAAAKPAVAAAAAPAARPAAARAPAAARTPTPNQLAERSRQKQCGAQWRADKAAGKTASLTWPQYWSACSKRLKGQA